MAEILETVYADANPTEDRLKRFQRLSKLQLNRVAAFNKWAEKRELNSYQKEIAQEAWNAAWASNKVDQCWEVIKRLTVFDESFRLPQLEPTPQEQIEGKFAKLMLAVSLLTLEIQRDYENGGATEIEESHGSVCSVQ